MPIQLHCPVCHTPLNNTEKGASCANNHQFDRARQGYLNLLPSHKKRSKNPGDDKAMIQARTRFLSAGYYKPVVQTLAEKIQSLVGQGKPPVILDAGCGEGYYTAELESMINQSSVCGVDIAKPGIVACSHRSKTVQWLVASVSGLPLASDQFDIIVSVFSRCHWPEFSRVLKPGGHILVLTPGQNHLMSLRQAIYPQVRPYPEDKRLQNLPEDLELIETLPITGTLELPDSQTIMDLLAMTPHYWHVKPDQKRHLETLEHLSCPLDMRLSVIQKIQTGH